VRGRRLKAGVAVASFLCAAVVSGAAATDRVDRSFAGGFVETPLSPREAKLPGAPNIWDLAPVHGGGFVGAIADLTEDQDVFGAVRYRPNGSIDRSFGDKGFTRPLVLKHRDGQAQAIAVQPDGRIVVTGFSHGEYTRSLLARFRPDGSLDRSFGHEGIVLWRRWPRHFRNGALHDIAIQPGGRIIAVGSSGEHGIGESSRYSAGIVTAYRSDGSLDRSFGADGQVVFPVAGGAEYTGLKTVRVLPGGRLLVAGFHYGSLFVARLLPDGELDRSFGRGTGEAKLAVNNEHTGCDANCWSSTAVAVRPDGRILVLCSSFPDVPAVVRLLPDGERDLTFGRNGIARVHMKHHAFQLFDMAPQRGRILVVGWDETHRSGERLRFAALRYLANGKLDRGFGHHGVWLHRGAEFSGAFATLNQSQGRVVVAGGSEDKPKGATAYESFLQLARFLPH
jgi:uncharacterized delta-60 repeat protein